MIAAKVINATISFTERVLLSAVAGVVRFLYRQRKILIVTANGTISQASRMLISIAR